jgi:hypothetical protein
MNTNKASNVEVLELSESSKAAQLKHAETIKKVEAIKRARLIQGISLLSLSL